MPVISRSNKVSRVARTGGSNRRKGERPFGFYALLALLTVLGLITVVYSRNERLSVTTPNNTPPLEPFTPASATDASQARAGDRWYEAYGIYLCDKFAPAINSDRDPVGLSTKNDGILYIHPFTKSSAGSNATLGAFAEAVELPFTDDSIKDPSSDTVYTVGETKCGDEEAELVVKEWADPTKPDEGQVLRGNATEVRVKNNAAVTIAFVPVGKEDIPLPESATNGALQAAPGKDTQAATEAPATADPAAGAPVDPAAVTPAPTEQTVPAPATEAPPAGG